MVIAGDKFGGEEDEHRRYAGAQTPLPPEWLFCIHAGARTPLTTTIHRRDGEFLYARTDTPEPPTIPRATLPARAPGAHARARMAETPALDAVTPPPRSRLPTNTHTLGCCPQLAPDASSVHAHARAEPSRGLFPTIILFLPHLDLCVSNHDLHSF